MLDFQLNLFGSSKNFCSAWDLGVWPWDNIQNREFHSHTVRVQLEGLHSVLLIWLPATNDSLEVNILTAWICSKKQLAMLIQYSYHLPCDIKPTLITPWRLILVHFLKRQSVIVPGICSLLYLWPCFFLLNNTSPVFVSLGGNTTTESSSKMIYEKI